MSNSSSETGPAQQPMQMPEITASQEAQNEANSEASEQAASAAEAAQIVQQIPAIPLPPITTNDPALPTSAAPTDDVTVTTNDSIRKLMEDSDLIEKEWVDRAKKIVDANREDPYKQSEELTVVKADYLKKRYDKNIKLK